MGRTGIKTLRVGAEAHEAQRLPHFIQGCELLIHEFHTLNVKPPSVPP
jgi:hypothetical protein